MADEYPERPGVAANTNVLMDIRTKLAGEESEWPERRGVAANTNVLMDIRGQIAAGGGSARGSSAKVYLGYDSVGGTDYLSVIDDTEE